MINNSPKIAIFFDWINQWGGAEKVLLNLIKLYPDAPVYTLVHDPVLSSWIPVGTKIITSFINKLPFSKHNPIFYTALYDIALEQFDFSDYDIVISTTSVIGHSLLTRPSTLFVCYFHNINRHLYEHPILRFYQKIDYIHSRRPDYLICNSKTVANRIQSIYHLTPQIINPGIDTDLFIPSDNHKKYFLIVSRLVPHKKLDIVIKVFKKNKLPLVVVGKGRQEAHLRHLAENCKNISFVTNASNEDVLNYYQNCIALICPQLEDFGLTAIEAQSCGKPVIAYGRGGNTETIISGKTGTFFYHQTAKSLSKAIIKFQNTNYKEVDCRQNALRFSDKSFMLNFKQSIDRLWKKHQTITF